MTEQTWPDWFPSQLDRAAEGLALQLPDGADGALVQDLQLAARLSKLDLSAESQIQETLRARLARPQPSAPLHTWRLARQSPYWKLAALFLVLLSALFLTNAPVLGAFSRIFGYGYLEQVGFIRMDRTLLLPGPLAVEGSPAFAIPFAAADQNSTQIWISGGNPPLKILLSDGQELAPRGSESKPGGFVAWYFAPLPPGESNPLIVFPGDREIQLGLIPAENVGLNPTAVNLPQRTPSSSSGLPCLDPSPGQTLCVQAAQVDEQGLHLLVAFNSGPTAAIASLAGWNFTLTLSDGSAIPLADWQPADESGTFSLRFAPFPRRSGQVTLGASAPASAAPDALTFNLPQAKPEYSPTPRAVQSPAPAKPASTPNFK